MAFPVILYVSITRLSTAVITASSTDTGYSASDIADLRAWKVWRSATLVTGITIDIDLGSDIGSADSLGLVNHNITSEAGTIELRADTSAHGSPATTVRQAAYTPTYGDVDLKTFSTATNLRYWRIVLAKGGNFVNKPYLGEVFIGLRTTLPEYLSADVDPFLNQVEGSVTQSQGGQYLGATLRGRTHKFSMSFGGAAGMSRSFFTSDINAFIDGHLNKYRPFIFQLDSGDADFQKPVYIKRAQDGSVDRKAVGQVWSRLMLTVSVEEAHSESP